MKFNLSPLYRSVGRDVGNTVEINEKIRFCFVILVNYSFNDMREIIVQCGQHIHVKKHQTRSMSRSLVLGFVFPPASSFLLVTYTVPTAPSLSSGCLQIPPWFSPHLSTPTPLSSPASLSFLFLSTRGTDGVELRGVWWLSLNSPLLKLGGGCLTLCCMPPCACVRVSLSV